MSVSGPREGFFLLCGGRVCASLLFIFERECESERVVQEAFPSTTSTVSARRHDASRHAFR